MQYDSAHSPSVAVGIVTHNRVSILPKAIDSALNQDYPNLRVEVLNDGSSDETSELSTKYPTSKWTNWTQSQGCIAGRDYLMNRATADYFVSLDDDAWFIGRDEVGAAVKYLEVSPKVAAVGFDILAPGHDQSRERTEPRQAALFIGCGHIVRLSAVKAVGGYVDSPGRYGNEEKDLSLRLLDAGYQVMLLPGVHIWHNKTSIAREQLMQHRSGVCNDFAMTLRRTPLVVLPIALLSKLWRHFEFARAHKLLRPFYQGLALFLKSVPDLWKTRRPVQMATLRKFVKLSRSQ